MRTFLLCLVILFSSNCVDAQSYHYTLDEQGNPARLKVFHHDSVFRYQFNGNPTGEAIEVMAGGSKWVFEFPFVDPGSSKSIASSSLQRFEPGQSPEGDMVHDIDFTPDGRMFGVLYQHSSNIYFYDSAFQLLEIVEVGDGPIDLELSNNKAYVCCTKSSEIYVINLSSFSFSRVFNIPENSCQIEVAPDESNIYIGCYSWMNGAICAYSLSTAQQLYYTTQPYIHHYGYYGNQGRCFYEYAKFYLSPSGEHILAAYTGSNRPAIFDAATGNFIKLFDFEGFRGAGFSVTADTLYFLTSDTEKLLLHRVKSSDLTVIDSILVVQQDILDYSDLAISSDGQKVMSVDTWTEYIYYFDFNTHTCSLIGESLFSNAWIRNSQDRKTAIIRIFGDAHFYNLETGDFLGELSSVTEQAPGLAAAVSPVGGKLVCGNDNLFFGLLAGEKIQAVDYDEQANLTNRLDTDCGQPVEADITLSAVITHDGTTLVGSNYLTGNVSFINYWSGQLDTLVNLEQVQHVMTIPGSDLLILYGYDAQSVWFIDPVTHAIEAEIIMNQVAQCMVDPAGEYAYIYTLPAYQSNGTLYKVQLHGSIGIIDQFQVNLSNCGLIILGDYPQVQLRLSVSPNGKMMLFPDDDPSLGSVIRIVDLELMNEMAAIPVSTFCTYDYAYSEDSKYALIGSNDDDLPLIYLNGNASFLIKYIKITGRTYSITYNRVDDQFYILQSRDAIVKVNPVAGVGTGTIPTNNELSFQIGIENSGKPVIRQTSGIIYQGEFYDLPGVSNGFYFDGNKNIFIIPTPGPDAISVFNEVHVGRADRLYSDPDWMVYPNPAADYICIETGMSHPCNECTVQLVSSEGETLLSGDAGGRISLAGIPCGIYVLRLLEGERIIGYRKLSVIR